MTDGVHDLLRFLDASPTPFHAVAEAVRRLEAAGFTPLDEDQVWRLADGDRHYAIRGGGSLVAFEVGTEPPAVGGFRVIGAHTDSPNLRIRPRADVTAHGYRQLAVETYGGVLLHTWLDRDLSVAGRVWLRDASGALRPALVDLRRPVLRIPSLAIHLSREIRTEGLKLNAQDHTMPVLGLEAAPGLSDVLRRALREAGATDETDPQVCGYDLMLYDTQPAAVGGVDDAFVYASRLDNLGSCHAALRALLAAERGASAGTRVIVLYDHEEVGSRSAEGAQGTLLADVLARCVEGFEGDGRQGLARALARSCLVSADMAHAVHPNYADKHEARHRPVIGRGPVIKTNVERSYASDGATAARFAALCAAAGVEPQHFASRNDMPCGSTIGPITAARVGIPAVDVGNPMLSMHSCREMAGSADVAPMIEVLRRFLEGE